MHSSRPVAHESPDMPPAPNRTRGSIALVALAGLLCSAASSPTGCTEPSGGSIGPSNGQVIGAAVGVGAVIAAVILVSVSVHNSHHTLKGCVFSGPGGLELRTSDARTFALDGSAASIKAGDRVKLHGSKVKKTKDSAGDQVFRVEKLTRDYGPCPAGFAAPAATGK